MENRQRIPNSESNSDADWNSDTQPNSYTHTDSDTESNTDTVTNSFRSNERHCLDQWIFAGRSNSYR